MLFKNLHAENNSSQLFNISDATIRNWSKLGSSNKNKLTKRANKTLSKKSFIPLERCTNSDTESFIQNLVKLKELYDYSVSSILYSLCLNLFFKHNLTEKYSSKRFANEYSHLICIDDIINLDIPEEFDILGTVYQSLISEGEKNIKGSYFTPKHIVDSLLKKSNNFFDGEFLDPCCGSGAFLLCVNCKNPMKLHGYDVDEIAVMIAKANLIIKYKKLDFYPDIKCCNFLSSTTKNKYDFIATNPPWGASNTKDSVHYILSKETSSMFFVKAYSLLKDGGLMSFLLPISLLNVKVHKDLREFILKNGCLERISIYSELFSGVTTQFVSIIHSKKESIDKVEYDIGKNHKYVNKDSFYKTENYTFTLVEEKDEIILSKIKGKGNLTLKNSLWALGIVTGDNAHKVHDFPQKGEEKIYTGKEIKPYRLQKAKKYILFDRNQLQQVAKDEFYRCKEKLVYKFISKKLVFAYDNEGSLFLNSANILIPKIEGLSIKTTMAFLNSPIFQYLYIKLFDEVKILKGNLLLLPFPFLTFEQDCYISNLVDRLLNGKDDCIKDLDKWMQNFYNLTDDEITHIKEIANGKAS